VISKEITHIQCESRGESNIVLYDGNKFGSCFGIIIYNNYTLSFQKNKQQKLISRA
jgi:hypothetical protein